MEAERQLLQRENGYEQDYKEAELTNTDKPDALVEYEEIRSQRPGWTLLGIIDPIKDLYQKFYFMGVDKFFKVGGLASIKVSHF